MAQVVEGRDGRRYEVSGMAGDVVRELKLIDDTLGVEFNEAGYFVVYQSLDEHRRPLVGGPLQDVVLRVPMMDWDRRVLGYFEQRAYEVRHGISSNERLDAEAKAAKRAKDHRFHEIVGAHAQRMHHSLRKDLGVKDRIAVPRSIAA